MFVSTLLLEAVSFLKLGERHALMYLSCHYKKNCILIGVAKGFPFCRESNNIPFPAQDCVPNDSN